MAFHQPTQTSQQPWEYSVARSPDSKFGDKFILCEVDVEQKSASEFEETPSKVLNTSKSRKQTRQQVIDPENSSDSGSSDSELDNAQQPVTTKGHNSHSCRESKSQHQTQNKTQVIPEVDDRRTTNGTKTEWRSSTSYFSPWQTPQYEFSNQSSSTYTTSSSQISEESLMGSIPRSPSTTYSRTLSLSCDEVLSERKNNSSVVRTHVRKTTVCTSASGKENHQGGSKHEASRTNVGQDNDATSSSIKLGEKPTTPHEHSNVAAKSTELANYNAQECSIKQRPMARRLSYSTVSTPVLLRKLDNCKSNIDSQSAQQLPPYPDQPKRTERGNIGTKSDWRKRLSMCRKDMIRRECSRLETERVQVKSKVQEAVLKVKEESEVEWKKKLSMSKREAVAMTIQATEAEKKGVMDFAKDCIQAIEILKHEVHAEKERKTQLELEMCEAAKQAAEAEECWRRRLSLGKREVQKQTQQQLRVEFQQQFAKHVSQLKDELSKEWRVKLTKEQRDRRLSGHLKMRLAVEHTAKEAANARQQEISRLESTYDKRLRKAVEQAVQTTKAKVERQCFEQFQKQIRNPRLEIPPRNAPGKANAERHVAQTNDSEYNRGYDERHVAAVPEQMINSMDRECRSSCQTKNARTMIDNATGNPITMDTPLSAVSKSRLHNVEVKVGDIQGSYLSRYRNYVITCDISDTRGIRTKTQRVWRYSYVRSRLLEHVTEQALRMGIDTEFSEATMLFPVKDIVGRSTSLEVSEIRAVGIARYIKAATLVCERLRNEFLHDPLVMRRIQRIENELMGDC